MVSVCTVPARGGRSCEHFGGYKTINRIPLPLFHIASVYPAAKWVPSINTAFLRACALYAASCSGNYTTGD